MCIFPSKNVRYSMQNWENPAESVKVSIAVHCHVPNHTAYMCMKLCTTGVLHTHTHPFNGPFSRTTQVSRYQKGKTNLDFTEARDSEWQWHQLGHMQVCTSLQTDNYASIPPLSFLQAGCPSCHPTDSVKALELTCNKFIQHIQFQWL